MFGVSRCDTLTVFQKEATMTRRMARLFVGRGCLDGTVKSPRATRLGLKVTVEPATIFEGELR